MPTVEFTSRADWTKIPSLSFRKFGPRSCADRIEQNAGRNSVVAMSPQRRVIEPPGTVPQDYTPAARTLSECVLVVEFFRLAGPAGMSRAIPDLHPPLELPRLDDPPDTRPRTTGADAVGERGGIDALVDTAIEPRPARVVSHRRYSFIPVTIFAVVMIW